MTGSTSVELTVYCDGACPLCRAEINHCRHSEGASAVTFMDVRTCKPDNRLSRAEALARFHVNEAKGTLISGAAAFASLWCRLPRSRGLADLVEAPLLLPPAQSVYRLSLPLRPWLLARLLRWQQPSK